MNIKEKLVEKIKLDGLVMTKKISSEINGVFFYKSATYDTRTVYSWNEAVKLNKEGFSLDGSQDIGLFILNAIFNL